MAKILVVDDSALARRIMRRILEAGGHQVLDAADGAAALEQYYLDRPDLVMLDITMAGMTGLDVLAQLLAIDPAAAVVIASADIQSSTRDLASAGGARAFLTKPYLPGDVLLAVDAALGGR